MTTEQTGWKKIAPLPAPGVALILTLTLTLTPAPAAAAVLPVDGDAREAGRDADYRIVNVQTSTVAAGITRTVTTVQVGANPLNRFFMHHVSRPASACSNRPFLLLPPVTNGFDFYEVGRNGDYAASFVGHFAEQGFDVWGYTARAQTLPDGICDSGAADCSLAAAWGLQSIVDDVGFIRAHIGRDCPAPHGPGRTGRSVRPVLGGVSLGSLAAAAVLNQHPDDYAGAVMIEGSIYDTDPEVRSSNQTFCAGGDAALAAGITVDNQQLPGFKLLGQLSNAAPAAASPLPGFEGLTNRQALVFALTTPQLTPFTPRPNFFVLAGDGLQGTFTFANDELLQQVLARLPMYAPVRLLRDINCGLAGERTFTDNLSRFHHPILIGEDGHGFAASMNTLASLFTSAPAVTRLVRPEYGHYDSFLSDSLAHDEAVLSLWLRLVLAQDRFDL